MHNLSFGSEMSHLLVHFSNSSASYKRDW